MNLQLHLISADAARRERLRIAFGYDPALTIVSEDPNVEQSPHPEVDVFVVDLAYPDAALPRFWMVLHILFTWARLMAVVAPPVDEAALQAALHAGVYHFVLETASPARLCKVVRAAVEGGFCAAPQIVYDGMSALFNRLNLDPRSIQVGALRIELTRRQVTLGPQPLTLSPREFRLVAYLAQNADRTVSVTEMLREVWQSSLQTGGSKEQVKSAVKRIRGKIEPDPRHPRYLLTVHGEGYSMPALVQD